MADESSTISSKMSTAEPVTAAELLRRTAQKSTRKSNEESKTGPDLDDEIRRLEAELEDDSSTSSSSSEDSDDDSSDESVEDQQAEEEERLQHQRSLKLERSDVLNFSRVKDERIEKLPQTLLPSSRKRVLKNIDGGNEPPLKKSKKKAPPPVVEDGLTAAVKEVLAGYKPRSAERLPFYCRVCAKQYDNEEEFFQHKSTEFHKTAVELEKKASYCKLCRKQLTSPAQLREHLSSRPHKERLQLMREKQQGRGRAPSFSGRGRSGGRGPPPRHFSARQDRFRAGQRGRGPPRAYRR